MTVDDMSQSEINKEAAALIQPDAENISTEFDELLAKIKPLSERPAYLRSLIYGYPGVGKTVFAATAPNALILDVEHGTVSLLNHPELANTPVFPVESSGDIEDFFWAFKQGVFGDIETLVIDPITEWQKKHMDYLLKTAHAKDPSKHNAYLPQQLDYKESGEYMRRILLAFRDLNCNLILIAHAMEDKDENDGTIFVRPAVTPKLAGTLEGAVDVMGFLTSDVDSVTGKIVRKLQVQPTRRVKAKTRIHLPAIIENPTFNDLLAGLKKG